jgi:RNA polymerase sigma-70 factor (ECF subfamily)
MTTLATARSRTPATDVDVDVVRRMDAHRAELRAHCQGMLRCAAEAEDAAQETLVRAWRAYDGFEGRASLRTWLYRIATNVCLDMIDARRRRPEPADVAAGEVTGDVEWPPPAPASAPPPAEDDPAERAVTQDTVRLAFMAALLTLPPRQRSVLVLRDVLRWRATEVAELLGTTVPSVQSALQRARATLARQPAGGAAGAGPARFDGTQQALLRRCTDAFEHYDVASLVSALS